MTMIRGPEAEYNALRLNRWAAIWTLANCCGIRPWSVDCCSAASWSPVTHHPGESGRSNRPPARRADV